MNSFRFHFEPSIGLKPFTNFYASTEDHEDDFENDDDDDSENSDDEEAEEEKSVSRKKAFRWVPASGDLRNSSLKNYRCEL